MYPLLITNLNPPHLCYIDSNASTWLVQILTYDFFASLHNTHRVEFYHYFQTKAPNRSQQSPHSPQDHPKPTYSAHLLSSTTLSKSAFGGAGFDLRAAAPPYGYSRCAKFSLIHQRVKKKGDDIPLIHRAKVRPCLQLRRIRGLSHNRTIIRDC